MESIRVADSRLNDVLNQKQANYIYPFFWIRTGETDKIINELNQIYNSGIRAVCVEGRPYDEFGEESWWRDVGIILNECERLGMKVWILDDKSFPTGFAADYMKKNCPETKKWCIYSYCVDAVGPIKDGAVMLNHFIKNDDEIIGVYACERQKDSEVLTGRTIDLTDRVSGSFAYFDLPDGGYRIFVVIKTQDGYRDGDRFRIDMLSPQSAEFMIEAVYKPHYEHFEKYFGTTLTGFFSDEPGFSNRISNNRYNVEIGSPNTYYPWCDELNKMLAEKIGDDYSLKLPYIWYDSADNSSAEVRVAYMDCITRLYEKNFSKALGKWCENHGVIYTGHVIEDNNTHTKTGFGAGHYFRAISGEHIPGVDVVLSQIIPGMTEYPHLGDVFHRYCDNKFFNYTLAKLAASAAHITPEAENRTMCEIFGAYGWAEGTKMMKWLTDFMLVRGINHFVPHAYSMKFPDTDCPPHFYAQGHNPQYRAFGVLMSYMNRMCHILNKSHRIANAAVLYQAEAEWSGAEFDYSESVGKVLYDNQIDYDILPIDAVINTAAESGKLKINRTEYKCFIVPHSTALPISIIKKLYELSQGGVHIVYADGVPEFSCEGEDINEFISESETLRVVPTERLFGYMTENGFADIKCSDNGNENNMFLRVMHAERNGDLYMFFNEDIHKSIDTTVESKNFSGEYIVYDGMKNTVKKGKCKDGKINISLEPYSSIIIFIGYESENVPMLLKSEQKTIVELSGGFDLFLATEEEYPEFKKYGTMKTLKNITGGDMLPEFSGHMRYAAQFKAAIDKSKRYTLDLGYVGEIAEIEINGKNIGMRIAPPYVFDITEYIKDGVNELSVTVTNHLGFQQRDAFSRYLVFEPSGLIGPVKIKEIG